ncbi:MAG: DUF362 domain-containing protein [Anaerolineae bacterium]|nr:DUF362 domain-containing protein [Anaerolineae bacterium]
MTFLSPAGIPQPADDRIPDVVINATYMINMPILKKHSLTGATLGFKNHLGTITDPAGLHEYISPGAGYFRTDYSPMVDIFRNPHIGPKTVLTIGDGLFASKTGTTRAPEPWDSFGDEVPNSLFLAQDPVAIDCVMLDLVAVEAPVSDQADAYLQVASSAGLGTFERGDPWGAGYTLIAYEKIEV